MELEWPQAIFLLGTIVSVCYTLLRGFRLYLSERKNPQIEKLKTRIFNLEKDMNLLDKDMDHSKNTVERFQEVSEKDRTLDARTIAKLEKKIEKITDLVIEIIRKNQS